MNLMKHLVALTAIVLFRGMIVLIAIAAVMEAVPLTAATIVVNTTSELVPIAFPGQPTPVVCTLRNAIIAANTNQPVNGCPKGDPSPIVDTILFNVGAGTPTIRPKSMLPVITEPVIIRGDSFGATRVEIDGSEASRVASWLGQQAHGLFLVTGGSTIRNLVINRFNGNGIVLTTNTGGGFTNFKPPQITEPGVPTLDPCEARPAEPECSSSGSGPADPDILDLDGADARNQIFGNFIGTDATGTIALGNGSGPGNAGIVTTTDTHVIGGSTANDRNLISGNRGHGIILGGNGNSVRGNFIGTDFTGELPLGNQFDGINIASSGFPRVASIGASLVSADIRCAMVTDPATGRVLDDRKACGNRIAFNAGNGIIGGFNAAAFLANSIFANGALGIDVDQVGPTANAANRSRNSPVFSSWRREISFVNGIIGTRVFGSIWNQYSQRVIIQVFHSTSCDSSGTGEGETYIGSFELPGNGSFSFVVPRTGGFVTATSTTSSSRKTSEFSRCLPI